MACQQLVFHGNYLIVARLQHITFYVLSIGMWTGMRGQGGWGTALKVTAELQEKALAYSDSDGLIYVDI